MTKDNYNSRTSHSDRQRNIDIYRARQAPKNSAPKPRGGKGK